MYLCCVYIHNISCKYVFKYLKFIYYCLFNVCDNLELKMKEASWVMAKTPVTSHLPNTEMFQRK